MLRFRLGVRQKAEHALREEGHETETDCLRAERDCVLASLLHDIKRGKVLQGSLVPGEKIKEEHHGAFDCWIRVFDARTGLYRIQKERNS